MTEMACGRKDDQIKFNVELSGGEKTHLLLAHGRDDGDEQILAVIEVGLDLLAKVTLRDLDIVLRGTVLSHEVEETIVDVDLSWHAQSAFLGACRRRSMGAYELVLVTGDVGDIHVVGGGRDILLHRPLVVCGVVYSVYGENAQAFCQ